MRPQPPLRPRCRCQLWTFSIIFAEPPARHEIMLPYQTWDPIDTGWGRRTALFVHDAVTCKWLLWPRENNSVDIAIIEAHHTSSNIIHPRGEKMKSAYVCMYKYVRTQVRKYLRTFEYKPELLPRDRTTVHTELPTDFGEFWTSKGGAYTVFSLRICI